MYRTFTIWSMILGTLVFAPRLLMAEDADEGAEATVIATLKSGDTVLVFEWADGHLRLRGTDQPEGRLDGAIVAELYREAESYTLDAKEAEWAGTETSDIDTLHAKGVLTGKPEEVAAWLSGLFTHLDAIPPKRLNRWARRNAEPGGRWSYLVGRPLMQTEDVMLCLLVTLAPLIEKGEAANNKYRVGVSISRLSREEAMPLANIETLFELPAPE